MRSPLSSALDHSWRHGVWLIVAGLALLAGGWVPLTGFALAAIGATVVLIARRGADPLLIVAQMLLYATLYVLFVAATLDGEPRPPVFDMLMSVLVMALHGPLLERSARRGRGS